MQEKNMEKYERYRKLKDALKKALLAGFYYEAIFIEYAIFEDRSASVLEHAGVNYHDKEGNDQGLKAKFSKIRDNRAFHEKYIRSRFTVELMDDLQTWRDNRNKLVHALCKTTYGDEYVKSVAIKGKELLDLFDTRVSSVNRYLEKR